MLAGATLGNYEFAAALLFESHGLVKSDDRAFYLAVVGRLGGDPLQPQPRSSHKREERTAMFGGETDDFVGYARDQRKQGDTNSESCPKCMNRYRHVHEHGDDHDRHQKARPAPGMISRILLDLAGLQRVAVLKREDGLVFGSVIFVHAAD